MEKISLWQSYIAGITDRTTGERYITLLRFFVPEFIAAFLSISLLKMVDAFFIGHLASASLYATQGVGLKFINMIVKIAEGISLGTLVLTGNYNGRQKSLDVGKAAITGFWLSIGFGLVLAGMLYFGGHFLLAMLNMPEEMIAIGVPLLRIRAVSVLFIFIYYALIGFLRGIKKPHLAMRFFLLGAVVFIFFDYALIFGKWGFPALQLQGSAIASVIQYGVMLIAVLLYMIFDHKSREYGFHIIKSFDAHLIKTIWGLSWPVILDKTTLIFAQLWLIRLIAPMGTKMIAGFAVIHDLEQQSFVPAVALGQVITFLVSNDYGGKNWLAIKNNIKKVIFLASSMVLLILVTFSLFPAQIIYFMNREGVLTAFVSVVFPALSTLVILDVVQLVLAGALRGAANVKTVMITRLTITSSFFFPISYICAYYLPLVNPVIKFILIYGSYYVSNGIIGIIFIYRFRREAWKYQALEITKDTKTKDIHEQHKIDLPGTRAPGKDVSYQDRTP